MKKNDTYIDLDGNAISLADLDAEERRLVNRLRRYARLNQNWDGFDNFAYKAVGEFYDARGVPRKVSRDSIPFQIAQDLSARIAVTTGMARYGDYRDELEDLIQAHFPSRGAFCKASGISPTMLSHVMAGRKQLSLGALTAALERVGYQLGIVPIAGAKQTG
jgi:hypothetical protein